jgi:hypothetical protein
MSRKGKRSRRTARRRYVNKNRAGNPTGIVKPSRLAEAKKRPWTMMVLLEAGPDDGGIDYQQFEAALQIVHGFDVLTRALGFRARILSSVVVVSEGNRDGWDKISPAEARLAACYIDWSNDLIRRENVRGTAVVEWVRDQRTITCDDVPLLVRALNLWDRHRDSRLTRRSGRRQIGHSRGETPSSAPPSSPALTHATATTASPRSVAPLSCCT